MDERLNIKDWRGKFQGQRAWIVGSGPSLDETPLDMIADEYSLGINKIASVFENTIWRPQFYFCASSYVNDPEYFPYVMKAVEECEIAIFCDRLVSSVSNRIPLGQYHKVLWLRCLQNDSMHNEPEDFWWNPLMIEKKRINNFGTTAFGASQVLAYLGFTTIILVGCDMGYKSFKAGEPDPNHFGTGSESGKFHMAQEIHDKENPRRFESHKIIRRRASKVGIKLINATIGGELEAYERGDYFELAEKK